MPVDDGFQTLFFEEAREILQSLEAGLMGLEARRGDREHLDRTFRAAHTLKGAAGMVGLRPIAEFGHRLEAVLDGVRSGRLGVTPEAITLLLLARDHLEVAIEAAAAGAPPVDPPEGLPEALADLAAGRPAAWPPAGRGPAAQDDPRPPAGLGPAAVTIVAPEYLDAAAAESLRCRILEVLERPGAAIALDLGSTHDLDVQGLALLAALARPGGAPGPVRLAALSPALRTVLEVTGVLGAEGAGAGTHAGGV